MFNNFFGSKKPDSSKKNTGNGSFDLSSLNQAKNKIEEKKDELNKDYDIIFKEALLYFARFVKNTDNKQNLKKAIDKFTQATEIHKRNYEPYYYLAYIAYISHDLELASKYIHIADLINPNAERILKLQNKIRA